MLDYLPNSRFVKWGLFLRPFNFRSISWKGIEYPYLPDNREADEHLWIIVIKLHLGPHKKKSNDKEYGSNGGTQGYEKMKHAPDVSEVFFNSFPS